MPFNCKKKNQHGFLQEDEKTSVFDGFDSKKGKKDMKTKLKGDLFILWKENHESASVITVSFCYYKFILNI